METELAFIVGLFGGLVLGWILTACVFAKLVKNAIIRGEFFIADRFYEIKLQQEKTEEHIIRKENEKRKKGKLW